MNLKRERCSYCGRPAGRWSDHIVPKVHGGPDAAWNFTPACIECNAMLSYYLPAKTGDTIWRILQKKRHFLESCRRTLQKSRAWGNLSKQNRWNEVRNGSWTRFLPSRLQKKYDTGRQAEGTLVVDGSKTRWSSTGWVAGVDGCPGGWFAVLLQTATRETRHRMVGHFQEVLQLAEKPAVVAVDIPIGLLDNSVKGGRRCDKTAREILRSPRASSVFSPPVRGALRHSDHNTANEKNKASSLEGIGISIQSFALREKLLEVDQVMTPVLQKTIREVHPELSFYELNNQEAMKHSKKNPFGAGLLERRKLVLAVGFEPVLSRPSSHARSQLAEDDVLDACVACWSAARILEAKAICIPTNPSCDSRGLRMEMWR